MIFDERVTAVAEKGFTDRQARFLTTVMLHAGVCVPCQYARFCGIVHGEKTRKFFAKLVRRTTVATTGRSSSTSTSAPSTRPSGSRTIECGNA